MTEKWVQVEFIPSTRNLQAYNYRTSLVFEEGNDGMYIPVSAIHLLRQECEQKIQRILRLSEASIGSVFYEIAALDYAVNHDLILECATFHAFGSMPREDYPFLGTGMADLIQQAIARDLKKRLEPRAKVIHPAPGTRRKNQLSRLGIQDGVCYSLDRYCQLIDESIERQKQQIAELTSGAA